MAVPRELFKACADLGGDLTPSHAEQLAEALAEHEGRDGAESVIATVPTAHFQAIAKRLLAAWSRHPTVSGSSLGVAIAAASHAHDVARSDSRLELVMSGPSTTEVHARMTDQVLLDLIASAGRELLLVTYSLYMYPELKAAVENAIDRGVTVTILAEDPVDNAAFAGNPALALAGLTVTRLRWAKGQRPPGSTSMHAKIAIADEHTVLITSANLSQKASGDNLEAGLLVRSPELAERLRTHIAMLRDVGILSLA